MTTLVPYLLPRQLRLLLRLSVSNMLVCCLNTHQPPADKDYGQADLPHTSRTEVDSVSARGGAAPPVEAKPSVEGAKTDKMEESLTCVICQDLLHDCVR